MAQAFLTPKGDYVETQTIHIFLYFSRATLNETFTAKYDGVLPSETTSIPTPFICGIPPSPPPGYQVLKGGIRNDNLIERTFSPGLTLTVVVKLACLNSFNPNSDQSKILIA